MIARSAKFRQPRHRFFQIHFMHCCHKFGTMNVVDRQPVPFTSTEGCIDDRNVGDALPSSASSRISLPILTRNSIFQAQMNAEISRGCKLLECCVHDGDDMQVGILPRPDLKLVLLRWVVDIDL